MTETRSKNQIIVFALIAALVLTGLEVWNILTRREDYIAPDPETLSRYDEIMTSERYSARLREAVEKNSELTDFVYFYPDRLGTTEDFDLSRLADSGEVPLLLQWDSRWGYYIYGDDALGFTGCGPLCLSMAAIYLQHSDRWDPISVAQYAQDNGYYFSGSGSQWALISQGCEGLGLTAREVPLSQTRMYDALDAGELIIAVLGPGDFTDSGHFILISGYDKGGFTVNDPNSRQRSATLWSYDVLEPQIMDMWAISRS